uniref:Uncharacterized protein n=1 Tax=Anopheles melas TaxID=34690 RepID=A0A182TJJ3_9DIPT
MFEMWSNVTSKLEAHIPMQTNVQASTVQNSSSGSIKVRNNSNSRKNPAPTSVVHRFIAGIQVSRGRKNISRESFPRYAPQQQQQQQQQCVYITVWVGHNYA